MARRVYTSKPREVEPFELDGVEFTPGNGLSVLDLTELARFADKEAASQEGIQAIGDFFRQLLGDDYDRFREHCRTHKTDEETLLQVITDLMEDLAGGFPTNRPSPSQPGPTNTGRGLRVVSLSNRSTVEVPVLTDEQLRELEQEAQRDAS